MLKLWLAFHWLFPKCQDSPRFFFALIYLWRHISACIDCVLVWGDWQPCSGGERSRSQVIVAESEGAGFPCPEELGFEFEGNRTLTGLSG